jgi:hypothetical protein
MSIEDVREHLDRAMDKAIVGDVDLDDVEHELDKRQDRLSELRAMRRES